MGSPSPSPRAYPRWGLRLAVRATPLRTVAVKPLADERVETLGRRVYAALELGEERQREVDGLGDVRRPVYERGRAALFELLRRLERAEA